MKNKKTAIIWIVAVLLLVLIGFVSYAVINNLSNDTDDASATESTETASGIDTIQNSKPETTHSTKIPSDLPDDTPLLAGDELLVALTTTMGDDIKEYSLNFQTKKSSDEVFAYYKEALSSNGWKTHVVRSKDTLNLIAASHTAKNLNANFSSQINGPNGAGNSYILSISATSAPTATPPMP